MRFEKHHEELSYWAIMLVVLVSTVYNFIAGTIY